MSVVIPAYNEALLIMASLTEIYGYMQGLSDRYRFELIVVDDGSTDETGAIAEAFAATRPEVAVLRHLVNFRLGQALRFGFASSKGDFVVAFDSDLSYAPEHIGRMLDDDRVRARPRRHRLALHEGRAHHVDPVRAQGHEQRA